eukprot:scaffold117395_cov33-Tisochrysis_lutea.AAC.1
MQTLVSMRTLDTLPHDARSDFTSSCSAAGPRTRHTALSCLLMRSTRIELMMSRSSSSPSRSMSAHHA